MLKYVVPEGESLLSVEEMLSDDASVAAFWFAAVVTAWLVEEAAGLDIAFMVITPTHASPNMNVISTMYQYVLSTRLNFFNENTISSSWFIVLISLSIFLNWYSNIITLESGQDKGELNIVETLY